MLSSSERGSGNGMARGGEPASFGMRELASQTGQPDPPTRLREQPVAFRILLATMAAAAATTTALMLVPSHEGWWPRETPPEVVITIIVLLGAGALPAIWESLTGSSKDTITIQEAFAVPLLALAGPAIAAVAVHCTTLLFGRLPGERARLWWRLIEHQSGRFLELAGAWLAWRMLIGLAHPAVAVAGATAFATTLSWILGLGSRITQGNVPARETWTSLFSEFAHQLVWLPTLAAMTVLLAHHGWLAVLLVLSPISVFHMSVSRDARRFAAESRVDVDQLTSLPGQGRFYNRLARELGQADRTGESVAVIILDLDDFKTLNDQHGHLVGDDCLKRVAQALSGAFREHDTVYRYGGEEFSLILPGADIIAGTAAGERARVAISAIRHARSLTASVGVACFPSHGRDAKSLVGAADRALYQAKRNGKNQVVLCDDMSKRGGGQRQPATLDAGHGDASDRVGTVPTNRRTQPA